MIVIPNVCILTLTPHTGTRALVAGLKQVLDKPPMHNHAPPIDVQIAQQFHGLPVYSIIRHPMTHALSFFWDLLYNNPLLTIADCIERPFQTFSWAENRLVHYHKVTDKYFIYEQGLENLFPLLGFDKVTLPVIGSHEKQRKETAIPPHEYVKLMMKCRKDLELYKQVSMTPSMQIGDYRNGL